MGSKQALTKLPQDVLRSFRALQPLLGPDGVSDALTVLRALHCRMQRLSAVADGQPEAQAPLVVPKVPEADWLPQSTVERPLEAEAAAQHSSAGSCMARRNAPVCREDSAPETADDARPGDAAEQQPPEQRQPSRKASGDRQLMTGAQQSEAEEAPAGAEARLSFNISCRQCILYWCVQRIWQKDQQYELTKSGARTQATAEVMPARAERLSAARAGHDVHALRGEALRQSDLIAELRSRMSSTEVGIPLHMHIESHCSRLRAYPKFAALQYLTTATLPCSLFIRMNIVMSIFLACICGNWVHTPFMRHVLAGGACCSSGYASCSAC